MFATTPIRLFIAFAMLALLGFGFAAFTAGAPAGVLLGTLASFAAACAVIVEVENDQAAADITGVGRAAVPFPRNR